MKATGIVRRIDNRRIIIPKEILRPPRIREGDPPQILTIDDLYIALHKIVDRYNKTQ